MATYVVSKNKRILFCGLNVDCLLVDLASYKFGSDFSEKLVRFLIEALRLNDNHLYDTPVNLQSCNLPDIPNFLRCVFCESNFVWPEGWRSQHFKSC